jgi:hypothetical protein
MSQPSFESASPPTVLTKKSAWNIYTVMLLLARLSLLLAMLFLYLEIREYGGWGAFKGPGLAAMSPWAGHASPLWT